MQPKDRLGLLLQPGATLNGIDFVEIANDGQTILNVHFLNHVEVAGSPPMLLNPTITGGETIPTARVLPPQDWSHDADGRPLLTLYVAAPGDFSFYTLSLPAPGLDPFFDHVKFSFKARCKSDLDCEVSAPPCPPLAGNPPPITYLAKDFLSFRKALSDFSALRYPAWQERSEADFGAMFMEALCSLADDLSYTQDRIAAEASILTASERRSIVRLARLVDYEPAPGLSSSVLLQLEVTGGPVPTGLLVSAPGPDGSSIDFETGTGLLDPRGLLLNLTSYPVSPKWNRFNSEGQPCNIPPYWWDDSQRCLLAGATEMWVEGHGFGFIAGQQLLIDTPAQNSADPPVREIVQLASVGEETDPLFNVDVTHLVFESPLQSNHDLTRTQLAGNLVPATQGRRYSETFAIDQVPPGSSVPLAIVRTGPNGSMQYRYALQQAPLVWLAQADSSNLPEILLVEQSQQQSLPPINWEFRNTLLDAEQFEKSYTIDPVSYQRLEQNSDGSISYDYAGSGGATIRFGDDVFGEIPESGSTFQVTYRVGGGSAGNMAADSITILSDGAKALITAVTNPMNAQGGADPEPNEQVQRLAPQAFRAVQYRAVRPEDYENAAETLPWVLRAGTVFRWTGSWLTVFTTADPQGTELITVDEQVGLINLLNRYRLAGYESYAPAPDYVAIDLYITVCALPQAFRGDVEGAVVAALNNSKTGFFYTDRFTFGTSLEPSALEAAIQSAYGVAGVVCVQYRERGVTAGWTCLTETLVVGTNQILRMDNDPSRPERGTLTVVVEGGK
jgi:hypothetical protein